MASEALQKFAQELKTLREEKGVSLTQISNRTKIDVKFLHAIEEARFDILPELYIRAFIKEYSQTLELNPKSILDKFDQIRTGKETIGPKEIQPKDNPVEKEKPIIENPIEDSTPQLIKNEFDSTNPSIPAIVPSSNAKSNIKLNYILGGIVLLVAIVIFYFAFINESSSEIVTNEQLTETPSSEKPRYEVSQPAMADQQTASETPTDQVHQNAQSIQSTQQIIKSESLHLSVQTSDRVWVKIYTDGKVVYQQMVEKGTNIKYNAKKSFAVSVGNAGAVKIFYNNKQVPNVGKTGESRNVFISPDGIRYYTISDNEKKSTPAH